MGLYPLLKTRHLTCDPAPVLEITSWQDLTSPCLSVGDAVAAVFAIVLHIIQIVHMDGAAAIFDGIADVLCDGDRGAVGFLVFAFADSEDFAAEQLVLPAHAVAPSSVTV